MKCKQVQEMISLYLDNKLSSSETEQIKNHLDSCPKCKDEFIKLKNIKNLLSGLKTEKTVSDNFTDSVMNKIQNEAYNDEKDKIISFNFIKKHFLVAASFVCVVAASSSMFFVKDSKIISTSQIENQNKIKNEIVLKSQLKDSSYYADIIESVFDISSFEDDDCEEDYGYSFLA